MMDRIDIKRAVYAVSVCALAVLACALLYCFDNKYTAAGPRGMNGALLLDEADVSRRVFLTDGWAVYGGVLLTPEDLHGGLRHTPDKYVFIGQYGGFEHLTGSPHGSATYRLVIGIPDGIRGYMLELPEIFSSCRVYVNGKELLSLGETDPSRYRFETGSAVVTFDAEKKIDLMIACSDFSHLYSGMVYPPAIGATDAVSHMLSLRLTLRAAVLAIALAVGVASLCIGLLSGRKGIAALYGLLCLLFAGYTCYPVAMTLARGSTLFYAAENGSFCAMLLVVILLQNQLLHAKSRLRVIPVLCAGFVCAAALLQPLLLPRAGLQLMRAYSGLITAYEWFAAGYITVNGLVRKKPADTEPLFLGMLVLDCSLVMDRLLPMFEPILTGWFPELGSFVLVLAIGVSATRAIARTYRENAVQEERVRIIIASGREHYQKMDELYDKLSMMRHDYKYHLNTVRGLLRTGNPEEIERYLTDVEATVSASELQNYCQNPVINALLASYADRCAKRGIRYDVRVALPETFAVPDYEMCIILGNLLENAVEASLKCERRWIELVCKPAAEQLAIMVRNSFDGTVVYEGGMSAAKTGGLRSTKKDGGLGLRSVRTVAARYRGELMTEWEGTTFTTYLLIGVEHE